MTSNDYTNDYVLDPWYHFQLLTTLYCPSPRVRFTGATALTAAVGASFEPSCPLHRMQVAWAAVALVRSNLSLSCSMAAVNSTILRSLRCKYNNLEAI